jgi:hypothetical protein
MDESPRTPRGIKRSYDGNVDVNSPKTPTSNMREFEAPSAPTRNHRRNFSSSPHVIRNLNPAFEETERLERIDELLRKEAEQSREEEDGFEQLVPKLEIKYEGGLPLTRASLYRDDTEEEEEPMQNEDYE